MENNVKERIRDLIANHDLTLNKISGGNKSLQVKLNRQINHNTALSADVLIYVLERFPEVSADWLITGRGDMHLPSAVQSSNGIPLFKTEAAAGFGSADFAVEKSDIEDTYKVREFASADFMLHVHGDSMQPLYKGGGIIAVKVETDKNSIQWGKVYLISTKSRGLLIKRIYDSEDGIICVSENPTFKPLIVKKNDVDGMAIVVGNVRIENL